MVDYHPISANDLSRLHQFGKKVFPGIFLGLVLYAGKNLERRHFGTQTLRNWKRWTHLKSMLGDCNAKEVLTPQNSGNFLFPIADGTVKLSGGDQVLRTSTLIRDNLDRGEEHEHLLGESDGSSPPLQDSSPDDGEARNDFWFTSGIYIYRHHVDSRVKLYLPREESFPIPLRFTGVTRPTSTNLDVMLARRMDDYWNIEGNQDLPVRGQGSHDSPYWTKNLLVGKHGPGSG